MKLLFSGKRDVHNTWGKLEFGATPLERIAYCEDLGFTIKCCVPNEDGSYDIYGYSGGVDAVKPTSVAPETVWKIYRSHTIDGIHYDEPEVVYSHGPGPWSHYTTITYNPVSKTLLCLKGGRVPEGFSINAFTSPDGMSWEEHDDNPVFLGGDSYGTTWSPILKKYIFTDKPIQRLVRKELPDNITQFGRRVLAVRVSEDGLHWEPSDSQFLFGGGPRVPDEYLILPDEQDPPELEFYRGLPFGYADRCFMMVLNYAPSPQEVNPNDSAHGPQLQTEWWISRDGVNWERPFREMNASGNSLILISHNPMLIGDKMLFHQGSSVWGMPIDRLTYVSSRANGFFSTVLFEVPSTPLKLNAMVPAPGRPNEKSQAYIMAELIDDCGNVIEGYERHRCIFQIRDHSRLNDTALTMQWDGKDTIELAGRRVRIRFYMRSSRIYAVTDTL